jgi:hypothetical protein
MKNWVTNQVRKLQVAIVRVLELLTRYWEWSLLITWIIIFGIIWKIISIMISPMEPFPTLWLIGLTLGLTTTWLVFALTRTLSKRKEKQTIVESIENVFRDISKKWSNFQKSPPKLSHEDIISFYGGNEHKVWECVTANLDFPRSKLADLKAQIDRWSEGFLECKVPMGRKQGKTILMKRFAFDLAKQSGYKVLWWIGWQRPADHELATLVKKYRSEVLSRTKRLVIFMDDLFPEEDADSELTPSRQMIDARNFRESISEAPIAHAHACIAAVYPSKEAGFLQFDEKDLESLLNKLVEQEVMPRETAQSFMQDEDMRRLYKGQLIACLCMIFEKIGQQPHVYWRKLQKSMEQLTPEEREFIKKIAACQTISLAYLGVVLRNNLRISDTLRELIREMSFETGHGICDLNIEQKPEWKGFVLNAPYFSRWILKRYGIRDREGLQTLYQQILSDVLSSSGQNQYESAFAFEYVRVALHRLARNWQHLVYPEFRGIKLAQEVFSHEPIREKLTLYVESLAELKPILRWAGTIRKLQSWELSDKLYLKAKHIAPKDLEQVDLSAFIHLTIGLKDVEEYPKLLLLADLDAVVKKANEGGVHAETVNKYIDAYVELVDLLKGFRAALDKWDELVSNLKGSGFKPDAVLISRRAKLLEESNEIGQAQKEYKNAIDCAPFHSGPETMVYCLQRYAVFLSEKGEQLDAALREDPETFFNKAEEEAKKRAVGYESVMNAWAKHKVRIGDIAGAKFKFEDAIKYCEERALVHSHSYLGFAKLLHEYGKELKDKPYDKWLAIAEDCCWKVINAEETERFSRLTACHQLGLLIGTDTYTSLKGEKRPNFREAIKTLENAFESSEPRHSDDRYKTFQDCITHAALAQTYVRWIHAIKDRKTDQYEPIDQLLKSAQFHSLKAFSGLSQRNNLTDETRRHCVKEQVEYAGFQFFERLDYPLAESNYVDAIKNMETWGMDSQTFKDAYDIHEHYATFLYDTKIPKKQLPSGVEVPEIPIEPTAKDAILKIIMHHERALKVLSPQRRDYEKLYEDAARKLLFILRTLVHDAWLRKDENEAKQWVEKYNAIVEQTLQICVRINFRILEETKKLLEERLLRGFWKNNPYIHGKLEHLILLYGS